LMDYVNVPTTVFTPLEYGACGYSQERAEKVFGKDNIECYVSRFGVLEGAPTNVTEVPCVPKSGHFIGKHLWSRLHARAKGKPWDEMEGAERQYDREQFDLKHVRQPCLAKLVVDKRHSERVIGFHYLGPNAGEITQGFALAVKLGATKAQFAALVGIHPTAVEEFTMLEITLGSGEDFMKKGGC